MLITTDSNVFEVDSSSPGKPMLLLRGPGVVRAAEGEKSSATAMSDGRLIVLHKGAVQREVETGLGKGIECLLLLREEPVELLIGVVGARLYRCDGKSVETVSAFDELPVRSGWHTPWGGPAAVRSLAAAPGGWVYADIHVGSIMRSGDWGRSWEAVCPTLDEDVHQVATCPAAARRVYANTARGVYVSEDNGESWQHRATDLNERYGRAIAVAPAQPDLILASVSDGPHGDNVHGELYMTTDAGRSWRHVHDGFPDSTMENIDTFRVAFTPDGMAWAAVKNVLYASGDGARQWKPVWEADEVIKTLSSWSGRL